jgi:glycosyltransferase involved in cell wall biosynthesis
MKIAFIVPSLINRGPIIVVKDIIENIIDNVDEITLFYIDNKVPEIYFPLKCKIEKINFFGAKKQLKKFDVVHSHMLRPDLMLAMTGKSDFIKICTLHNFMFNDISNTHSKIIGAITEKLWCLALKRFDKIICLSKEMRKYYENAGLNNKKLEVIYNGRPAIYPSIDVSTEEQVLLTNIKQKYFIVGVSAQLTKRKGIEQIIKVLSEIDDIALVIVGDGPEKNSLQKLSKDLKVENRCKFLGYKKDGFKYFKYFDGYCMSSRSEGFPLALLEAACFSLPTIVSNILIFKEIFSDQEVIFFELDNKISLIEGLKKMISDKGFSAAIRKKFLEQYTSTKMADNYLHLYKTIDNDK